MIGSPEFRQLMESSAVEEEKEDGHVSTQIPGDNEGESKGKKKRMNLMQPEERAISSVPWSVYGAYITASGSTSSTLLLLSPSYFSLRHQIS